MLRNRNFWNRISRIPEIQPTQNQTLSLPALVLGMWKSVLPSDSQKNRPISELPPRPINPGTKSSNQFPGAILGVMLSHGPVGTPTIFKALEVDADDHCFILECGTHTHNSVVSSPIRVAAFCRFVHPHISKAQDSFFYYITTIHWADVRFGVFRIKISNPIRESYYASASMEASILLRKPDPRCPRRPNPEITSSLTSSTYKPHQPDGLHSEDFGNKRS